MKSSFDRMYTEFDSSSVCRVQQWNLSTSSREDTRTASQWTELVNQLLPWNKPDLQSTELVNQLLPGNKPDLQSIELVNQLLPWNKPDLQCTICADVNRCSKQSEEPVRIAVKLYRLDMSTGTWTCRVSLFTGYPRS